MPHTHDHLEEPRGAAPLRRPDGEHGPALEAGVPAGPASAAPGARPMARRPVARDLLGLQRAAGNAAVTSLVGPAVQREVHIDTVTSEVDQGGATATTEPGAGTGPVSAAGGATTVSGASIHLAAPITTADGIVRADTVIANSVIAANYTPGAGNEW